MDSSSPAWGVVNPYLSPNHNGRAVLAVLVPALVCFAVSAEGLGQTPASAPAGRDDASRALRLTPAVKVFREASPAVVNISTTTLVTARDTFGFGGIFEEMFDLPFGRRPRQFEAHSVGSGFLIHQNGYVVTNAHVVDRVSECKIIFADGTQLAGKQVAIDRKNDLAVLKVDADKPLPHLKLGRSNDLMPGETVVAIGNPLGLQHTVTTGVVSALDRELRFSQEIVYSGLIQTDASINPGNSGGPLLNVLGELIGINTAIRGDAQNIGFAIPVDRLHEVLPAMLDVERLRRVRLGLHFEGGAGEPGVAGVRVQRVDADSPAEKAGLEAGDAVTAIDGTPTPTFIEAFPVLENAPAGTELKLNILRENGKRKTVTVALAEVPKPDGAKLMLAKFGMRVRELTTEDLQQLGLRQPIGLFVIEVSRTSQAAREGISAGDLVTSVADWPTSSLDGLGYLLEQVKAGDRLAVRVVRIGPDAVIQAEPVLQAQ
jgi:serine protease Do